MLADEFEEFVGRESVVGGLDEELFDERLEGAEPLRTGRGAALGDETSRAGVAGEHAFVGEAADGFLDGVRVHAQLAADDADGWHLCTGQELTRGNCFFHCTDDLFVDRLPELNLNSEWKHDRKIVLLVVIQIERARKRFFKFDRFPEYRMVAAGDRQELAKTSGRVLRS